MEVEQLLRTTLFVSGIRPEMIAKAPKYGADCLTLDLEDSVPPAEKEKAREIVAAALGTELPQQTRVFVRINPLDGPFGLKDLEAIVTKGLAGIRVPKCESAQDIRAVDSHLARLEERHELSLGSIALVVTLETAKGVLNGFDLATASPRIIAIVFGPEDYTADIGTKRSREGTELLHARSQVVLCAAAAKVQAMDGAYADVRDQEGLIAETQLVKRLGFKGKTAIHPGQIEPIHQVFAPGAEEIAEAKRILAAYEEAAAKGIGAVLLDGRLVELPVVKRARRTLMLAGMEVAVH
jgi:citrate lyase subunit beta/citryl-CoA lyase